jgi:hypothetical protein
VNAGNLSSFSFFLFFCNFKVGFMNFVGLISEKMDTTWCSCSQFRVGL